jgi:hypothetical protein
MIAVLRFDQKTSTNQTWFFELYDDLIRCFKYERSCVPIRCTWLLHDQEWRGDCEAVGLDPTGSPPFPDDVIEEAVANYRKKLVFQPPPSVAAREVTAIMAGLLGSPQDLALLISGAVDSILAVAHDLTDEEWKYWTSYVSNLVDDPADCPNWPASKPTKKEAT